MTGLNPVGLCDGSDRWARTTTPAPANEKGVSPTDQSQSRAWRGVRILTTVSPAI